MAERMYTVVKKCGYRLNLKAMTHKQACTFKTKMMKPNDWLLEELPGLIKDEDKL